MYIHCSDPPHLLFEQLQVLGKRVVLLETGGVEKGGWTFVCVVNEEVRVPHGKGGLQFIKDFISTHVQRHAKPPQGVVGDHKNVGDVPPFQGGFVGFVSYDFEVHFVYTDEVYASPVLGDAEARLSSYAAKVDCAPPGKCSQQAAAAHVASAPRNDLISFSEYEKRLSVIKEKLLDGETYQVNFSTAFSSYYPRDPWLLYKKLTVLNPSPFQMYMPVGEHGSALISNSPERLMKIDSTGHIITQPIKGTMPRGATPEVDERNEATLLKSGKNAAELAMIVDLSRNDLGRVCVPGSVRVTHPREIQKYSHVIHTVATIEGQLEKKYDWYDALLALFPGGSVTGCPKKRTMEIIAQLEDAPRGIYCGSAGYIDLSGACDFNILIRSLWFDGATKKLTWRAGGGIVIDSDPQEEYEELLQKAAAIHKALQP